MQPKNSPKGEFFNDIELCSMISLRSREIPTVTVFPRNDKEEMDCCALYLRQFTSFPFQEMFRLRFTPLNMTRGGGV